MTRHTERRIMVCPADRRRAVNAALDAMGFGPETFGAPMVRTQDRNDDSPTHYCCDWAMTADELAAVQRAMEREPVTIHDAGPLEAAGRLESVLSERSLKRRIEASATLEVTDGRK